MPLHGLTGLRQSRQLLKVIEMSAENKSVFYSNLQWPVAIFYYFKLRKFSSRKMSTDYDISMSDVIPRSVGARGTMSTNKYLPYSTYIHLGDL